MSKLIRAVAKFHKLSAVERRILLEASLCVPLVHQLQQRLPFTRWHTLLDRTSRVPHAPSDVAVSHIAWAVNTAAERLPGQYKCLPRAYATHVLLARHGYASEVRVGVSKDPQGKMEAHAWVVVDGQTVMGQVENLARFVPLPDFSRVFS